jgi:dipeptidase E
MKLLLTSAGLRNDSLRNAVRSLVEKENIRIAFIPTAANTEIGDKHWLIDDLVNCRKVGAVDIVDISAIPKEKWLPRIKGVDVLVFGGGNMFHLMHWITKSGLQEELPELLKTRVYVGISAGSMVTNQSLSLRQSQHLYEEDMDKTGDGVALGYVPFFTLPHLNSADFPKVREENIALEAQKAHAPIYAIDDNSAIKVVNGKVDVISEGKWKLFNAR